MSKMSNKAKQMAQYKAGKKYQFKLKCRDKKLNDEESNYRFKFAKDTQHFTGEHFVQA